MSFVDDFEFAQGRDVRLDEVFWMNADGTLGGYFVATDDVSGCTADYRLQGRFGTAGANALDAVWTSISLQVGGCDDPSFDVPPAEVVATEGDLWDDELDGAWTVSGDTLRIVSPMGSVLEYTRAL